MAQDASMATLSAPLKLEIVESTVAASSIAYIVEREFDLSTVDHCSFLAGGFNDNYDLRLGTGEQFIARLSKQRPRGGPNLPFELSLLEHLKNEGIAVASARRTTQGNWSVPLLTPEGGRDLVLFNYLNGKRPGDDLDAIRLTGHGLARIHASAHRYAGPPSVYKLDLAHLLWRPLERIDSLGHVNSKSGVRSKRARSGFVGNKE
jgi:Ser/Thr protein kinase RdoA (MazF antagonist)